MKTRIEKVMQLTNLHPLLKGVECEERGLPSQHTSNGWDKQMIGRYVYASKFTKGKVVLDACCGLGWGAYMLASNAKRVYAAEQNPDCVKFIETHWNEPIIVPLCTNIFKLNLEEKVDVITLMEAIEHFDMEDGIGLLTKLCDYLKDDGKIILSSSFVKNREKADRLCAKNPFHKYIYTKKEMKTILSNIFEDSIIKDNKIFCCSNKIVKVKQEKISILIANYNNENYIDICLDSLFAQTNDNWEAYILDDCSTDSSLEILSKHKDSRIKVFYSDENTGYSGTLKKLVELSKNDIVGILDPDDALYPNAVDVILKYYSNNPEASFVYSKYHKCNANLLKPRRGFSKVMIDGQTNLDRWCVSHFKTFRKDMYFKTDGFDPSVKSAVDKDLILKMEEVTELHFIDKVLYKWRNTGKSLSTGTAGDARCKISLDAIVKNAKERRYV